MLLDQPLGGREVQSSQEICRSFIHGCENESTYDQLFPNYHPASNQVINNIVYASDADCQSALTSAQTAFTSWSTLSCSQRGNILLRAAELLRERVVQLARIEVLDTGKPISEAVSVDIHSAADALEYFAKTAMALTGSVIPDSLAHIFVTREPLGVCVGIGAWNYPLQIACWKAAPALVMGNTMIYKPSEQTPLTTLELAKILIEAGLPPGVFNVVLGDGSVGEKLLSLPGISKISFTGSVPVGKKIMLQAAEKFVPVTLELGGKSPLIIFEDADLDEAVSGSMLANFYTQGEICSNGTRVFVARNKLENFMDKLIERTARLKVGNPFNESTQIGALISRAHHQRVLGYIQQGIEEGADLALGGKVPETLECEQGNFVLPTIFANCHDEMTIVREEIFGPVMCVLAFDEEDEVIQRANATQYGLSSGLFTENIKRAHRVAKALQAGVCWVNHYNMTPLGMPFGGRKHSGIGRENGHSVLLSYSQEKSIYIGLSPIDCPYI